MSRGNGITKSTMVEAGFWRELLAAADSRGGIRTITFGDGSTVVYDPTLRTGVIAVPDDLMYGPPGMANGGPQVYTFPPPEPTSLPMRVRFSHEARQDGVYAVPDAPGTMKPVRVAHSTPQADSAPPGGNPIPEIGEIDLSVPLRRSRFWSGEDPRRFGRFLGPDDFPGEDFPSGLEDYNRK